MKQKNRTESSNHRGRMLDAAQKLMLAKGYSATTVDDVCDAAGVTKGSFYYYFASKEELGAALVERFFESVKEALLSQDLGPADDPRARIERFFALAAVAVQGPIWRDGCLLGSFVLNLSETHPRIRTAISDRFKALNDALANEFRQASEVTKRQVDANILARQFLVSLEGGLLLAKAHAAPELVMESLSAFKTSVFLIFDWA